MPVTLGAPAQAGFDRPLDLLQDCHRRIESFLEMILRVVQAPNGHLTDEHRRALDAALRYFREAAPRHTQDEEASLFPRLRQNPSAEVQAALQRVAELEADHVRATALHEDVERLGQQWLSAGSLPAESLHTLTQHLQTLRDLYCQHIHVEDTVIFPLAGTTLPAADLAQIGQEMKARRNAPCDR